MLKGVAVNWIFGIILFWSSLSLAGFGRYDLDFLWPNGAVPYEIDGSCPIEAGTIRLALEDLSRQTKGLISFVQMTDYHLDGIRFKGMPQNNKRKSLGSVPTEQIGRGPGVNVILLHPKADRSVIQHELLHKLGLKHEHQRPDRDDYVQISPLEIRNNALNYAIERSPRYLSYTDYDLDSIMHYGTNQTNGDIMTRSGKNIADPDRLSAGDMVTLRKMYERAQTKHGGYLFKIKGRYQESYVENKGAGFLGLGGYGIEKRSIIDESGKEHSLVDDLKELQSLKESDPQAVVEIFSNMASGDESSGFLKARVDRLRIHFSNGTKMEYVQKRILTPEGEDGEMMERVKI